MSTRAWHLIKVYSHWKIYTYIIQLLTIHSCGKYCLWFQDLLYKIFLVFTPMLVLVSSCCMHGCIHSREVNMFNGTDVPGNKEYNTLSSLKHWIVHYIKSQLLYYFLYLYLIFGKQSKINMMLSTTSPIRHNLSQQWNKDAEIHYTLLQKI